MKLPLALLALVYSIVASETRNRNVKQPSNDMSNAQKCSFNMKEDSSSRSLLSPLTKGDDQSGSTSTSSGYDEDLACTSTSTALSPMAVLNRVKWHGGMLTASQAVVLPATAHLLSSNPSLAQLFIGLFVYILGLSVEGYGLMGFAIVPTNQYQFWVAKVSMVVLAMALAYQIDTDVFGQFASGVNTILVAMSMVTLFLPYIRLHDIKDL